MRAMFYSAALFNLSVVFLFVFATEWTLSLMQITPAPSEPVYLHFFCVLVAIFGMGYFWIAREPDKNRPIIRLGAIGKLSLVVAGVVEVMIGNISWQILIPLAVDLIYSLLFFRALSQVRCGD